MSETPLGEQLAPAPYPPGWTVPVATLASRRPGTLLAAAIVTWASSAIIVLGTASLLVFLLSMGEPIIDAFEGARGWAIALGIAFTVWSLLASLLAWWALTGRGWARWGLAVSSVATVVASTLTVYLGLPLVSLAAGIVVPVLLFIGGANDWYRTQGASS